MAVDYDPAIIGRVFETTEPFEVSPEMVANFCSAIGESNPLHIDAEAAKKGPYGGLTAPPSFAVTLSSHVKEIYEKTGRTGSMVFVVVRTTLTNQKSEVVAHVDHRFMNRT